jgi:peptidoglycan hydrolase-like protein with peptidoglycan-binding domain
MVFSLTWLPTILERAGLKVSEVPDWRTRGRREMGLVRGVMVHHTAGARTGNMPSLNLLMRGRADLAGPLAQLGLGRDGTFYVIAAGSANHAGPGRWRGVTTGNSSFIGIEAENSGRQDDDWPEVQLDALRRGCAAILKHIGADQGMVCGHKEWALPAGRKPDPLFDMPEFRERVGAVLAGRAPPPVLIPPVDTSSRLTLRRGAVGELVRLLQSAVGVAVDGVFGGATEAAVRRFQLSHGLVPDGIAGPKTWAQVDQVQGAAPTAVAPAAAPAAPRPVTIVAMPAGQPALPTADDAANPVRVDGARALAPDGRQFARRFRLGFFQLGSTRVSSFVQSSPDSVQGIAPSTLRIVAAVTENEGRFEAINSYDSAFLSVGLMQWTVGEKAAEGELASLLARIREADPAVFQECYGRFGLDVRIAPGAFTGFLVLDGRLLDTAAEKEQLRSATWAYRFWRAAHHPLVRRCQILWAAARIDRFSGKPLHGRQLREWLSSELGMAMILDQHVNRPAHVPATLNKALTELLGAGTVQADPGLWTLHDEDALLDRYVELRAATNMTDQLGRANRLIAMAEHGHLSAERGSFA